MEIYKVINDFPNYEVSTYGNIRSKNCILKPIIKRGYVIVQLYYENKRKFYSVSRLVAQAFIPNPENKPKVDHKDRNKLNNNINNLRWVTSSENNINRNMLLPKTGERNIHLVKGYYQVSIKRNKKYVYDKYFKTLEEAKTARDNFLETL